jgi:hypothetical protein
MAEVGAPKVVSYLTPSIFLHTPPKDEKAESGSFVQFTLKVRANGNSTSQTYKKKVERFYAGTPTEWIELQENLEEIWTQNNVTTPADLEANVKALLRHDSLTSFEAYIEEQLLPAVVGGRPNALTNEMIEKGLDSVAKEVFPYRALEIQKLWMRRSIRKPKDMSTRKMAASLTRMNTKLSRFPGATENDLFSASELLEIIEWSLPPKWQAKFDLAGYVPSAFDRARLVTECEALERAEATAGPPSKSQVHKKDHQAKHKTQKGKGKDKDEGPFYCTEHGKNPTHHTEKCFTLINRAKKNGNDKAKTSSPKTFSNNKFRKDINAMSKGKSKKKVLDLHAAFIKRERSKLKARASKKKKTPAPEPSSNEDTSDDSDDMSVNMIEPTAAIVRAAMKADLKKAVASNIADIKHSARTKPVEFLKKEKDFLKEEKAFQDILANLGQPQETEPDNPSVTSSEDEGEEPMKE